MLTTTARISFLSFLSFFTVLSHAQRGFCADAADADETYGEENGTLTSAPRPDGNSGYFTCNREDPYTYALCSELNICRATAQVLFPPIIGWQHPVLRNSTPPPGLPPSGPPTPSYPPRPDPNVLQDIARSDFLRECENDVISRCVEVYGIAGCALRQEQVERGGPVT